MAARNYKIVGLSAAVAALVGPVTLAPMAANASVAADRSASGTTRQTLQLSVGDELMNFTVDKGEGGVIEARHTSHASHSSHASHASHSSHHSSR